MRGLRTIVRIYHVILLKGRILVVVSPDLGHFTGQIDGAAPTVERLLKLTLDKCSSFDSQIIR